MTNAPLTNATVRPGDLLLLVTVNGKDEEVVVPPLKPLADVLRDDLGLTGTKLGCRAGDCGSCTVLVDDVPVASCLMPVSQAADRRVVTIEGLADGRAPHALQDAFARNNASQCGFCIPGILMAAVPLVTRAQPPTREEVVEELAGNLCRCTGYESIVTAIVEAATATKGSE